MGAPNLLKSATWLLAPSNVLKCAPGGGAPQKGHHFTKGLRSTGGPDLLKWGVPGGGIKSAKVAPTPYVYYPRVSGPQGRSDLLAEGRRVPDFGRQQ